MVVCLAGSDAAVKSLFSYSLIAHQVRHRPIGSLRAYLPDMKDDVLCYHGTHANAFAAHHGMWFAFEPGLAQVGGVERPKNLFNVVLRGVDANRLTDSEMAEFDAACGRSARSPKAANRVGERFLDAAEDAGYNAVEIPRYALLLGDPNCVVSAKNVKRQ